MLALGSADLLSPSTLGLSCFLGGLGLLLVLAARLQGEPLDQLGR